MCSYSAGVQFICEMQVARNTGFHKFPQFYAVKACFSHGDLGDQYQDLKGIIFIAITYFIIFPHKSDYKSDHITLDKVTYEHDLEVVLLS